MRFATALALLVAIIAVCGSPAFASYSISSVVTELSTGYQYTYSVRNNDPSLGYGNGLDVFLVLAPGGTNVIAATTPPAYYGGYYWTFGEIAPGYPGWPVAPAGTKWFYFWGPGVAAVYPYGSTAVMSFTTDNKTLPGLTVGSAMTYYYDGSYSFETHTLQGPATSSAAVPEVPTTLLCMLGGSAIGLLRKLKRR